MVNKIACHECGAKETHIKIRAFCGQCESHLEHYRKTRDKARDRQMVLAEGLDEEQARTMAIKAELDQLRAFAAMVLYWAGRHEGNVLADGFLTAAKEGGINPAALEEISSYQPVCEK